MELLPDELLERVLRFLPTRDVVAVGACCSRLHAVAFSDAIWRRLYAKDFPHGRTSSGGLRWRDVYARAIRSLPPNHSRLRTRPGFGGFEPKYLAFDHARQRILGWDWSNNRLSSVGLDGTVHAQTELKDVHALAVDADAGTYLAVVAYVAQELVCLDADLRVLRSTPFDRDCGSYSLVCEAGRLFGVALMSTTRVVEISPQTGRILRTVLSWDALLPIKLSGCQHFLIAEEFKNATAFDFDGEIVWTLRLESKNLAISQDGIIAVTTSSLVFPHAPYDPDPPTWFHLLFYSSSGQLLRSCYHVSQYIEKTVWSDDCLLVAEKGNSICVPVER
eukprot:TRINITY_DN6837_c0_g5_i3.p1 TRINITY_DN6837_c0_g5~~TRINITY_DN6837_c0_g5_i3.p1  ORF type:complete len:333 (-),score=29.88 TRINITY_DN6837_c0_g5_i3:195-1193(-)